MRRLISFAGVVLVAAILCGVLQVLHVPRFWPTKEIDTVYAKKNSTDVHNWIAKEASHYNITDETIEERLRSGQEFEIIVHELVQRAEWSRSLTILLIGESGVGKATLVNGILGEELIVRNESSVQLISKREINGIDVTVIDTAEIMDAEEDEIEEIKKEAAKGVDLFLFCIRMTQVRFRRNDIELIWKVREVFPVEIWNNAIFILTYANQLRLADEPYENHFMEKLSQLKDVLLRSYENHFIEKLSQWKDVLLRSYENHFVEKLSQWRKVLLNAVQEYGKAAQEVAQKIPVIPAGYKDPKLPYCDEWSNCKNWFSELWYVVLERVQCGKKIALLEINRNRFRKSTGGIDQPRLPHEMEISPISDQEKSDFQMTYPYIVMAIVLAVILGSIIKSKQKDEKVSKKGEEGREGAAKPVQNDGEEGGEGAPKPSEKEGEERDKSAAKPGQKDGEEGGEGAAKPGQKEGEEVGEGAAKPSEKEGEERDKGAPKSGQKDGEEGGEGAPKPSQKKGEEGGEGAAKPSEKGGEERGEGAPKPSQKEGEEWGKEVAKHSEKAGEERDKGAPKCGQKDGEEGGEGGQ